MKNYNIKQIANYYFNEKHTISEISKITNIPFSTIKYQLKKHGYVLDNRNHYLKQDQNQYIVLFELKEITIKDIFLNIANLFIIIFYMSFYLFPLLLHNIQKTVSLVL